MAIATSAKRSNDSPESMAVEGFLENSFNADKMRPFEIYIRDNVRQPPLVRNVTRIVRSCRELGLSR